MATRMLIDARHREETRVAVVENARIEEFDFESAEHKQLKGNIYLAKVTRVEPSLQAAFVDYGGNRHGFLAFSEIHPDYYQIPKEDRDALLREEAEHAREEAALRDEADDDAAEAAEAHEDDEPAAMAEIVTVDPATETGEIDDEADHDEEASGGEPAPATDDESHDEGAIQDLRRRRMNLRRRYKIQDVIRRRQVLLVQVVKEERGTKGAALTTYLSLAGRYCVLMPNTSHGGGISRKISNAADRKRLKSVIAELKLPDSMGCIVRTAGMSRTKTEIKRDFTYLARLWDEIRDNTLKSSAPARIHTDSDLIKRAIRDIYNREIEEVIVEGGEGFKAAKDFMKLLMPSHARRVKEYADAVPLFQRFHVEDQLGAMYQPTVQLKSGGYLVINPTEALVSIDINSGRSTREHNIEQTALKTNIEAAREIARQLRLRDMAGLIVIDFIDMDHHSNNRKVEKALKDALKFDRARIQVGRISPFGLLEMSRQRLRTGVLEASTMTCPHCEGSGLIRTAASAGLSALRMLEEEAARGRGSQIRLSCSQQAAVYVLNAKRSELIEIEDRYGVRIAVVPDSRLDGAAMSVESAGPPPEQRYVPAPMPVDEEPEAEIEDEEFEDEEEEDAAEEREEGRSRRRRSRRGGRGRSRRDAGDERGGTAESRDETADEESEESSETEANAESGDDGEDRPRRSRRGRRGGRRRRGSGGAEGAEIAAEGEADAEEAVNDAPLEEPGEAEAEAEPEPQAEEKPKRRSRTRKTAEEPAVESSDEAATDAAAEVEAEPAPEPAPKSTRSRSRKKAEEPAADAVPVEAPANDVNGDEPEPAPKPTRSRSRKKEPEPVVDEAPAAESDATAEAVEDGPRRVGWWQRTFGT